MDVSDLAVFAAVARAGAITGAARALNTVQSNVTQRVRALAAELGVALFPRHARGVTLTQSGRQLLPYADRVAQLIAEARRAASDGAEPRGSIVVGALESATAVRLPPVLAAYAAACPQVDVEIGTGTSASLIDAVRERRVDAAFVAGPIDDPLLVAITLVEEELVLVTMPGRTLDFGAPGGVPAKFIVFRAGCTYRARLEAILAGHGVLAPRRLEFGTLDGIIGCVAAGIGVTLLPRVVVAAAAAAGRVALHRLPPDEARVTTQLIRRADGYMSTALARFIAIAREKLAAPRESPARRARRVQSAAD